MNDLHGAACKNHSRMEINSAILLRGGAVTNVGYLSRLGMVHEDQQAEGLIIATLPICGSKSLPSPPI
jgi:hypothetical protein